MSNPRHLVLAALALIAALGLAACGTDTIDQGEAEDFVREYLESGGGPDVPSVECPDDVEAEEGGTFECTAEAEGGLAATIPVEQVDGEGQVQIDEQNIELDRSP